MLVPVKSGPLLGTRGEDRSSPTSASGPSSVVVAYASIGEGVYLFDPVSAAKGGPASGNVELGALTAAFDVGDDLVITLDSVWSA